MLQINSSISIPMSEFQFSHARASGPGGQNVNKVNSKVILHWDVKNSPSLPEHVRRRFCIQWRKKISRTGHLVVNSHRHRDQPRNTTDCLNKVREMVRAATVVPKKRKPTKPTKGSNRRRLEAKKQHAQRKRNRQSVKPE